MALTARAARWRALAPALVLVPAVGLGLGAPGASPARAQAVECESAVRTSGAFRSVAKPAELPGPLLAHAVEPADPRTVYLADRSRVAVSRDAGCTWELVLEVPSAPSTAISSLTVPDADTPSGRLLVVVTTAAVPGTDGSGAVSTVHSRRGDGQPFRQSASVPGRVRPAVAAGDPDVVYLATTEQGQAGLGPLRSTDGGATFAPTRGTRTLPPDDGGAIDDAPRQVAVDPDDRDSLLVGAASLQRSLDGGSSYGVVLGRPDVRYAHALAPHGRDGDATGTVVLAATGNRTSGLASGSAEIWSVPRTGDPRSLPTDGLRGVPQSLAAGQSADEVVLTVADLPRGVGDGYEGSGSLYLLDAERQTWVDVMDRRGYPLFDAQIDRSADPAVHLHSSSLSDPLGADEYVVYDPPAEGRVVPPAPGEGSAVDAPPSDEFPAPPGACPTAPTFEPPAVRRSASRLTPEQAQLPVDATGAATHQLDLDLAGDAAALDLVILLDTSDSMGPAAEGLVCGLEGLVTGLAADGVDLRVGLAEFWDSAPGTRYKRLVDLAPPGRDVQRALRLVETRGGEEAHRTALVQAVTGRGLVVDGDQAVRPGQGMSLRDGALKVVLHVTDEPWTATTRGEPSPAEVVDTLNAADVRHVGLQVLQDAPVAVGGDQIPGLVGQRLLRTQLDQFSAGTGAFAPAGGVDCDGDGAPDLREGEPLVCTGTVQGGTVPDVGAAVRSLVQALPVRGPVTLRPTPSDQVQVQVQARFDDVDLRAAGRYAFPLLLSCRPGVAGPVPVRFDALAGPLAVSTATAVVLCPARPAAPVAGDPPLDPAPVLAAAPQGPSAAVAAAPPVPPPPAVQVPAPAPAAAAAGAVVGAAGSAGAGASSSASALGSVSQAAGSSVTGLAGAPKETVRQAAEVSVSATGEDSSLDAVPLAAVPLAAGVVSTAALATHLIATRRRPRLRTAQEHLRRR